MLATLLRRPAVRTTRAPITARMATELLEDRVVLSSHSVLSSVAEITGVNVDEVDLAENEVTLTLTGTVLGTEFTRTITTSLDLLGVEEGAAPNGCDILNLAVGPVDLNVLGLNIELDDCNDGPITVDIYGTPGEGQLLGNLLCDVAGLLDNGATDLLDNLLGVLDGLSTDTTDLVGQLEGAIQSVLQTRFDELLASGTDDGDGGTGDGNGNGNQGGGRSTTILNLELANPEGIQLDLLGLNVETSPICLVVSADQGAGNLLGNLVGSIARLLDRDPGNAVNALLNRAERLLDQLDLGEVSDDLLSSSSQGRGRGR